MNGATNGIGGAAGGSNGLGAGMGPMNAGQQMDVNFLWQKVLELSEVLRENRERTRGVVEGAEELAVSFSLPSLHTVTGSRGEAMGSRFFDTIASFFPDQDPTTSHSGITDPPPPPHQARTSSFPPSPSLTHELHTAHRTVSTLARENRENTRLIGDYEVALGSVVEMVRNYAFSQNQAAATLATHYNRLLQEEKDAHLEARLEGGEWRGRFERCVEMLREGYRRACEEEGVEEEVVRELREEVRALRKVVGEGGGMGRGAEGGGG